MFVKATTSKIITGLKTEPQIRNSLLRQAEIDILGPAKGAAAILGQTMSQRLSQRGDRVAVNK